MAETTYDGPRSMLPKEYDDLMNLQEIAYGETRRRFLNYYPHISRPENFVFDNHYIIKQKGKIISHVGLFPMDVYASGSETKLGGIGGVATHPDARGKGAMGKLLNYATEKMREREIPFSILWGDTQRYRHFGWETAGRQIVFHLSRRSTKEVSISEDFALRSCRGEEDLETIAGIHKKEPLRCVRSLGDYEQMLDRTQTEVWLGSEGDLRAYAVCSRNEVIEFGGEPSIAVKIFAFMLQHYPAQTIKVYVPYKDSLMLRSLYEVSFRWEVVPLGMIKVIDLKDLLRDFRGQLQKKIALFRPKYGSAITLRMSRTGQQVSLVVKEQLEIVAATSEEVLVLSEIDVVRLLFGPSPEDFGENTLQRGVLGCLFPLDFYVWGLDAV